MSYLDEFCEEILSSDIKVGEQKEFPVRTGWGGLSENALRGLRRRLAEKGMIVTTLISKSMGGGKLYVLRRS